MGANSVWNLRGAETQVYTGCYYIITKYLVKSFVFGEDIVILGEETKPPPYLRLC